MINKIYRKLNSELHNAYYSIITICECMLLRIVGIKVGKACEFRGWASFFRHDKSVIIIGDRCRFNSSKYTNHVGINHRCIVTTMRNDSVITIGNQCGVSGGSITSFSNITIGNNVRIGANCVIMDGDFHLDDPRVSMPKPIKICDNVWLGYGVVVMKGVTIGENSVIGVNSIVTKDIPANVIAAGSPCKVIRSIEKV